MLLKRTFNITEAAMLIGVSRPTIYAAINAGTLKAWKPVPNGDMRVNYDDLQVWSNGALPKWENVVP